MQQISALSEIIVATLLYYGILHKCDRRMHYTVQLSKTNKLTIFQTQSNLGIINILVSGKILLVLLTNFKRFASYMLKML